MLKDRSKRQVRTVATEFAAREENEGQDLYIEGYFAVYGQETELWPGAFEEVAPGAFDNTLSGDIRALTNHDTTLVLGRTKAGTLELRSDSRGLWGRIKINRDDSDAMNTYARVKRGDVDQCSFGFDIVSEEVDWRDNGTVKWTITEVKLYEVTVCTFPQYEDTGVQARKIEFEQHRDRQMAQRKQALKERVRGCLSN